MLVSITLDSRILSSDGFPRKAPADAQVYAFYIYSICVISDGLPSGCILLVGGFCFLSGYTRMAFDFSELLRDSEAFAAFKIRSKVPTQCW